MSKQVLFYDDDHDDDVDECTNDIDGDADEDQEEDDDDYDKICFRARLVVRLASELSIICPDGSSIIIDYDS